MTAPQIKPIEWPRNKQAAIAMPSAAVPKVACSGVMPGTHSRTRLMVREIGRLIVRDTMPSLGFAVASKISPLRLFNSARDFLTEPGSAMWARSN